MRFNTDNFRQVAEKDINYILAFPALYKVENAGEFVIKTEKVFKFPFSPENSDWKEYLDNNIEFEDTGSYLKPVSGNHQKVYKKGGFDEGIKEVTLPSQDWLDKIKTAQERYKKEQLKEKITRKLKQADKDVAKIGCFNKLISGKYDYIKKFAEEQGFYILHEYKTTCGNYTVIISNRIGQLRVPDDWKGLLIGKNGANIKKKQREYGRIELI